MIKKMVFLAAVIAVFISCSHDAINSLSTASTATLTFNDLSGDFSWAKEAVAVLAQKGAISGIDEHVFSPKATVSREQFAKILVAALDLETPAAREQTFLDVPSSRWSFSCVEAVKDFFPKVIDADETLFLPERSLSREDAVFAVVSAIKAETPNPEKTNALLAPFSDVQDINPAYASQIAVAVEKKILSGNDGLINPKSTLSRAEAAVLVHRALLVRNGKEISLNAETISTPIVGQSTVSLANAKRWAESKGAHERFIAVADLYWEYGAKTGIRPEVLYAQAAKETNYGKYTGNVIPTQNNWAGIKTMDATGDKTEDHESFSSPEDGVRAHFNHMAAYLGKTPIGNTHDRYAVAASASWAGSISSVEELGGHWAPDKNYGFDIVEKYIKPMETM